MRQKDQLELNLSSEARGEAPSVVARAIEARAAKACLERPAVAGPSMEAIVEGENLKQALAQVKRNKGAAGIDGMSVDELAAYLKKHWPTIRAQLLEGTYKPQPVRRVEIPKASGGTRPLGIPTVLDRFIQQAVMQVLGAFGGLGYAAQSCVQGNGMLQQNEDGEATAHHAANSSARRICIKGQRQSRAATRGMDRDSGPADCHRGDLCAGRGAASGEQSPCASSYDHTQRRAGLGVVPQMQLRSLSHFDADKCADDLLLSLPRLRRMAPPWRAGV